MHARLRHVFARREDPYAGVDLANASRLGGVLWFLGALLSALPLPFVHPEDAIGDAGWIVAGVMILGSFLAGYRMIHMGTRLSVNEVLAFSYASAAGVAVLVWLTGGIHSPYGQLYLPSLIYTCAVHPPRRVVPYLALLFALMFLPLAYDDGVLQRDVVRLAVQFVLWLGLALVVVVLMNTVREQRVGLRREGEHARRLARVDQLTGLPNRRAFDEDLALAIGHARMTREPLSVLVGDLDDFKDFNDRFGHLAGDGVLQAVAASLRAALRGPDVAYRWGGDEFAVLLPRADHAGALLVAERVEAAVTREAGPDGARLGMCTGVAEFGLAGDDDAAALVERADRALLHAKGSGVFENPH